MNCARRMRCSRADVRPWGWSVRKVHRNLSRDSPGLTRVLSSMDWQLEKKPASFCPNFCQTESFGLTGKLFRPGHDVGVGPVERLMKT
jgi:hypothetical protein